MVRCPFGHPYDERQYSSCPWCNPGETRALGTRRLNEKEPPTKSLDVPQPAPNQDSHTVVAPYDTPGATDSQSPISPVAGWIVCYEGMGKGRDYPLRFGRNSIGRDESMDIVLKDKSISRNSHLFIIYDAKHNNFVIQPGTSHGLVYRNDHLVSEPEELLSNDRLEIGNSRFVFVALCGENFQWLPDEK